MRPVESARSSGVVVAFDSLAAGGAAVDWAAGEAERRCLPLTVMHVADYAVLAGPFGAVPFEPGLLRKAARETTAVGVERARKTATTVPVAARTATSGVVHALTEASGSADLLVLGSHGHGSVGASLLGSVAYGVTSHAHCPVVVVRGTRVGQCGPKNPVVVGVDGTESALAAVRFAADSAARAKAPLLVLSAYRPATDSAWVAAAWPSLEAVGVRTFDTTMHRWAQAAVEAAIAAVGQAHPDLVVLERVVEGSPAGALEEASRGAGLVVLGSRDRGVLGGFVLGSVGHRLVLSADCPVVMVR